MKQTESKIQKLQNQNKAEQIQNETINQIKTPLLIQKNIRDPIKTQIKTKIKTNNKKRLKGVQMLHRIQQEEALLKTKLVKSVSDKRRSETRTKIELGGLVHKSELTKVLGIELGDELHSNPNHWEKEAILLGALIDIREKLLSENGDQLKREFQNQGELSLKYSALKLDDTKL